MDPLPDEPLLVAMEGLVPTPLRCFFFPMVDCNERVVSHTQRRFLEDRFVPKIEFPKLELPLGSWFSPSNIDRVGVTIFPRTHHLPSRIWFLHLLLDFGNNATVFLLWLLR